MQSLLLEAIVVVADIPNASRSAAMNYCFAVALEAAQTLLAVVVGIAVALTLSTFSLRPTAAWLLDKSTSRRRRFIFDADTHHGEPLVTFVVCFLAQLMSSV